MADSPLPNLLPQPLKGEPWCQAAGLTTGVLPRLVAAPGDLRDVIDQEWANLYVRLPTLRGALLSGRSPAEHAAVLQVLQAQADVLKKARMRSGALTCFQQLGPTITARAMEPNSALRQCQRDALSAVCHRLCTRPVTGGPPPNNTTIVLPTGTGKTPIIALLPWALAARNVLIITPRITIRDQMASSLRGAGGNNNPDERSLPFLLEKKLLEADEEKAMAPLFLFTKNKNVSDLSGHTQVLANASTFHNRQMKSHTTWTKRIRPNQFDLVIVDEAHHFPSSLWRKIKEHFGDKGGAKVVFVTATPLRSDGDEVCARDDICYELFRKVAVDKGWIRDLRAVPLPDKSEKYAKDADKDMQAMRDVLRKIKERLAEKNERWSLPACKTNTGKLNAPVKHQAIGVARDKKHAELIQKEAKKIGLTAKVYHEEVGKHVIHQFEQQKFDLIIVVHMLGEGYDHPPISITAFFNNVGAGPKAMQFIGRGVRRIAGEHKEVCADVIWHERHVDIAKRFMEMKSGRYGTVTEFVQKSEQAIRNPVQPTVVPDDFKKVRKSSLLDMLPHFQTPKMQLPFLTQWYHGGEVTLQDFSTKTKRDANLKRVGKALRKRVKNLGLDEDINLSDACKAELIGVGDPVDCGGGGACFYRSLATVLNLMQFEGVATHTWRSVKTRILNHAKQLSRDRVEDIELPALQGIHSGELPQLRSQLADDPSVAEVMFTSNPWSTEESWRAAWVHYVDRLYGSDWLWADHFVLEWASQCLGMRMHVHSTSGPDFNRVLPGVAAGAAPLAEVHVLHHVDFHYQAISNEPADRIAAAKAQANNCENPAAYEPPSDDDMSDGDSEVSNDADEDSIMESAEEDEEDEEEDIVFEEWSDEEGADSDSD